MCIIISARFGECGQSGNISLSKNIPQELEGKYCSVDKNSFIIFSFQLFKWTYLNTFVSEKSIMRSLARKISKEDSSFNVLSKNKYDRKKSKVRITFFFFRSLISF